jgi:hypothetical protein
VGQVFSAYFGLSCQFSFHRLPHTHHLLSGAGTIGQLVADVPSGLSLTPPQETKKKKLVSWWIGGGGPTAWRPGPPDTPNSYLWGYVNTLVRGSCWQRRATSPSQCGCVSDYPQLPPHLWTDAAVHDETSRPALEDILSYNSQIFDMGIFSCFGMWNSSPRLFARFIDTLCNSIKHLSPGQAVLIPLFHFSSLLSHLFLLQVFALILVLVLCTQHEKTLLYWRNVDVFWSFEALPPTECERYAVCTYVCVYVCIVTSYGSVTNNNGFWIGWLDLLTRSCSTTRNHHQFTTAHNKWRPKTRSILTSRWRATELNNWFLRRLSSR